MAIYILVYIGISCLSAARIRLLISSADRSLVVCKKVAISMAAAALGDSNSEHDFSPLLARRGYLF